MIKYSKANELIQQFKRITPLGASILRAMSIKALNLVYRVTSWTLVQIRILMQRQLQQLNFETQKHANIQPLNMPPPPNRQRRKPEQNLELLKADSKEPSSSLAVSKVEMTESETPSEPVPMIIFDPQALTPIIEQAVPIAMEVNPVMISPLEIVSEVDATPNGIQPAQVVAETVTQRPSQRASYMDLFLRLLDSVFLLDRETYAILEQNDACERLLELKHEDLSGKFFSEFVTPEDREELGKKLRIARRKYYPLEFETHIRNKDGKKLTLQLSACSLKLAGDSEVLQVIAKDITSEKEAIAKIDAYMKELQGLNKKLEELSITDELTKLSNVRHFRTKLKEEHERAARYKGSYAVILFDVDNFKHYNDTNGHPAGDQLLRVLGKILKDNTRGTDLSARYGGEEFVILCPEANNEVAMAVAERYRKLIENHPFDHAAKQPLGKVSVSIGVACFPAVGQTPEDLVKAADQGLYHSKKNGRNRSTSFLDLPAPDLKKAS